MEQLEKSNKPILKIIKEELKKIEKELENIIKKAPELTKNYELVKSVPCIGKVSGIQLLICTGNFKKINTYRKSACYAGVAPFEYMSGTSIRGRTKISQMGNKCLKKLLHICSLSVLKHKRGELYEYYKRKIEEGKHTMSVLNALRNKLLNRIFACLNKGTKYSSTYRACNNIV